MSNFVAAPNKVIVRDLECGARKTAGGIILGDDDGTLAGIRSRWAEVFAVGEGVLDIKAGDWVLLDHGRWSRTIMYNNMKLNMADYPNGILLVADEKPKNHTSVGKNS